MPRVRGAVVIGVEGPGEVRRADRLAQETDALGRTTSWAYNLRDQPTLKRADSYEAVFSEGLWRLPGSFVAYRAAGGMGEVGELPALRQGHITLGTLEGHPEAGRITFGAYRNERGDVVGNVGNLHENLTADQRVPAGEHPVHTHVGAPALLGDQAPEPGGIPRGVRIGFEHHGVSGRQRRSELVRHRVERRVEGGDAAHDAPRHAEGERHDGLPWVMKVNAFAFTVALGCRVSSRTRRAAIASSTVDMPTRSPPIARTMPISAGVS